MSTYPTTPAYSWPVTATLEFDTGIAAAKNGTEQRWMRTAGKASWTISYPRLTLTERDALLTFFDARKGSLETFDFPFLGSTYSGCYFDSDTMSFTESDQGIFAGSVKICMVSRSADGTALGSDFPTLTSGNRMQRPYTHSHSWDTVKVITEGGRYTAANRSATLRNWTAGGTVLTTTDALAIWNYFSQAQGRYRQFAFTDPDSGTRYTKCRFGSDSCSWVFSEPGANQVQVTIQELP